MVLVPVGNSEGVCVFVCACACVFQCTYACVPVPVSVNMCVCALAHRLQPKVRGRAFLFLDMET